MHPQPSRSTMTLFAKWFVWSCTADEIVDFFRNHGISPCKHSVSGYDTELRTLVERHYYARSMLIPDNARALLAVFSEVLNHIGRETRDPHGWGNFSYSAADAAQEWFDRLTEQLRRDGLTFVDGRIVAEQQVVGTEQLAAIAASKDLPGLRRHIDRLNRDVDTDPWGAIGAAKDLIETTCKTICREQGVELPASPRAGQIVSSTLASIDLLPNQIDPGRKGAKAVKKTLGQLSSLAIGMFEVRNEFGDGHGHEARAAGLEPRHAKLAAGAAATLCLFLFETHAKRNAE